MSTLWDVLAVQEAYAHSHAQQKRPQVDFEGSAGASTGLRAVSVPVTFLVEAATGVPLPVSDLRASCDVLVVFFAARWHGGSRKFAPQLRNWLAWAQDPVAGAFGAPVDPGTKPRVRFLFVSLDRDKPSYMSHRAEMPDVALSFFSSDEATSALRVVCGMPSPTAMPHLVACRASDGAMLRAEDLEGVGGLSSGAGAGRAARPARAANAALAEAVGFGGGAPAAAAPLGGGSSGSSGRGLSAVSIHTYVQADPEWLPPAAWWKGGEASASTAAAAAPAPGPTGPGSAFLAALREVPYLLDGLSGGRIPPGRFINARMLDYLGVYVAAKGNEGCKRLLPTLAQWYRRHHASQPASGAAGASSTPRFDLVCIPVDSAASCYHEHVASMPWKAVPFDPAATEKLLAALSHGAEEGAPTAVSAATAPFLGFIRLSDGDTLPGMPPAIPFTPPAPGSRPTSFNVTGGAAGGGSMSLPPPPSLHAAAAASLAASSPSPAAFASDAPASVALAASPSTVVPFGNLCSVVFRDHAWLPQAAWVDGSAASAALPVPAPALSPSSVAGSRAATPPDTRATGSPKRSSSSGGTGGTAPGSPVPTTTGGGIPHPPSLEALALDPRTVAARLSRIIEADAEGSATGLLDDGDDLVAPAPAPAAAPESESVPTSVGGGRNSDETVRLSTPVPPGALVAALAQELASSSTSTSPAPVSEASPATPRAQKVIEALAAPQEEPAAGAASASTSSQAPGEAPAAGSSKPAATAKVTPEGAAPASSGGGCCVVQ